MNNLTKDDLNNIIKEVNSRFFKIIEHDSSYYVLDNEPLIKYEDTEVFILKEAKRPKQVGLSIYIDRLIIPKNITKKNLGNILGEMTYRFECSEFVKKVMIVGQGFEIPGSQSFIRETESGEFEARLYAQGFKIYE